MVTGATSGIGKKYAEILSETGFKVILMGRNKELLASVSSELKNETKTICLDLSECNSADDYGPVREVLKSGEDKSEQIKVSLLINNAGCSFPGEFEPNKVGRILKVINVNIRPTIILPKIV